MALTLAVGATIELAASDSGGAPHPSTPVVGTIGGVPLQQARCEHWLTGSGTERQGVLRELAAAVGGMTPYGPATTLGDAEARRLFDRACPSPIAHSFLLYELYIRAAAFRSAASATHARG